MVTRRVTSRITAPTARRVTGDGVSAGSGGPSLDAAVTDWVSRVVTNGGTVSTATQTAANNFVTSAKSNGYWNDLNRVNLFAGSNLDACLTPLLVGDGSATDTNENFVSGDYSEATGLEGNGTNKRLDTGISPADLGKDSNFMAVYCRSETTGVVRAYFGVGVNGADAWNAGVGSTSGATRFGRNSTSTTVNGVGTGIVQNIGIQGMRRGSSANFDVLENATITNGVVASNATASSLTICVFGRNDGSGAFWAGVCGGYIMGSYLDNTKYAALQTDWEVFQDALSRGVL